MPKTNGKPMTTYGHVLLPDSDSSKCHYCDGDSGGRFDYIPPSNVVKNQKLLDAWGLEERWAVPCCHTCINRLSYHKYRLKTPLERRMFMVSLLQVSEAKNSEILNQLTGLSMKPWERKLSDGSIYELSDTECEPDELRAKKAYYSELAKKTAEIPNHFDPKKDIADFGE